MDSTINFDQGLEFHHGVPDHLLFLFDFTTQSNISNHHPQSYSTSNPQPQSCTTISPQPKSSFSSRPSSQRRDRPQIAAQFSHPSYSLDWDPQSTAINRIHHWNREVWSNPPLVGSSASDQNSLSHSLSFHESDSSRNTTSSSSSRSLTTERCDPT